MFYTRVIIVFKIGLGLQDSILFNIGSGNLASKICLQQTTNGKTESRFIQFYTNHFYTIGQIFFYEGHITLLEFRI